jgi:hypothetical protein
MRWTSLFGILLALAAPCGAGLAQPAKTAGNPADAAKPVQIVIKAREPYKQSDGTPFTPSLELRCEETNAGKHSVVAILATGGVETAASNEIESFTDRSSRSGRKPIDNSVVDYSDERPFHSPKMKFDEGKPASASWRLNLAKDQLILPGNVFLKGALTAHTVSISFPAVGESNRDDIVSQFDLSGFKAEFDKHPECSAR